MTSKLNKSQVEIRVRVPREMARQMLKASLGLPGCKRPEVGSVAHYLRESARLRLEKSVYPITKKAIAHRLQW